MTTLSNLVLAGIFGLTFSIGLFAALAMLFVPGFFERLWTRITKPLGIALILGYAIVCLAATTQVDLATQVKNLLAVANGGTGLASGTSGGILGYTGSGTLASSAVLASNAIVIGSGAGSTPTSKSWADMDSTQYAAGGGTAQAQTVTLSPAATSLAVGLEINWLPAAANTGSGPTLAVNGLTAKPITKLGTTALVANDLTTTAVASAIYDGTEFQLQNPQTTSAGPTFADNEVPSGSINGSNTTFTLSYAPNPALSLNCYLDGVQQRAGGADFTLSSLTITYGVAPPTGETLICSYRH